MNTFKPLEFFSAEYFVLLYCRSVQLKKTAVSNIPYFQVRKINFHLISPKSQETFDKQKQSRLESLISHVVRLVMIKVLELAQIG